MIPPNATLIFEVEVVDFEMPGPSIFETHNGVSIVIVSALICYFIAKQEQDVLMASGMMSLANAALCLVFNLITNDYSWVDRLWSVLPFFYAIYFAYAS